MKLNVDLQPETNMPPAPKRIWKVENVSVTKCSGALLLVSEEVLHVYKYVNV